MSIEAMAIVLHHSRAKGMVKLVLLGIANHEGDGGAYPAVTTLARYANSSDRTVQRAIDKLVSIGELTVRVQAGGDQDCPDYMRPNRYEVTVSCPSWCDRSRHHRDTRGKPRRLFHTPSTPVDNRVTPASPGRGEGVTPASPGGVTPASPKPSIETSPNPVVPEVQDTREGWCDECGLRPVEHDRAQAIGTYHAHPWTTRASR